MKRIKKLLSVVLTMAMALTMVFPVMAAAEDPHQTTTSFTIKLENGANPETNTTDLLKDHTFYAYQVFYGTQNLDQDRNVMTLGDVTWGSDIDQNAFPEKLNAISVNGAYPFNESQIDTTNAAKVAGYLQENKNNTALLTKVAQAAYESVKADVKLDDNKKLEVDTAGKTQELQSGYYLIVDETATSGDSVNNPAVLHMTGETVIIKVKTDKPTLTKEIYNVSENDTIAEPGQEAKDKLVSANTAPIGAKVWYVLSSKVPDMSSYVTYKYVVEDLMFKGLSFNESDLTVSVNGKPADYRLEVVSGSDLDQTKISGMGADESYVGGTHIKIVFKDFYKTYNNPESLGTPITIRYSATLNPQALSGVSGNENMAKLNYWRNPNTSGKGDPDDFDDEDPKGETPWDKTQTFTTILQLTKVDGKDANKTLSGAQFQITGEVSDQSVVTGFEFIKANEGDFAEGEDVYYKLNDNKGYTTTPGDDGSKYDKNTLYKKVPKTQDQKESYTKTWDAVVGDDGVLIIKGLTQGTYTIKELKAPDGYNLLTDDINVVITAGLPDTVDGQCSWSAVVKVEGKEDLDITADANNILKFNVENNQGVELPSTGGIGTTIFYIIGGILVVGAAVLLVTKKRMSKEV